MSDGSPIPILHPWQLPGTHPLEGQASAWQWAQRKIPLGLRGLVPSAEKACGYHQRVGCPVGFCPLYNVLSCTLLPDVQDTMEQHCHLPQAARQPKAVLLVPRDPCCSPASPCQTCLTEVTSRLCMNDTPQPRVPGDSPCLWNLLSTQAAGSLRSPSTDVVGDLHSSA